MAVFGRRHGAARTAAAAIGAFLPDAPAIGMVLWANLIVGYGAVEIHRDLYFSEPWQAVFAPWHSFFVWAAVLGIGLLGRWRLVQVCAVSALLHLLCDLPLHAEDAHRHLWPVSDWRFQSPLSYWNPAHFGDVVQPIEVAFVVALAGYLLLRHRSRAMLAALAVLLIAFAVQLGSFAMIS
jgi:hypothetical protein